MFSAVKKMGILCLNNYSLTTRIIMTKRLFSQLILSNPRLSYFEIIKSRKQYSTDNGIPVREIQIPVLWGHVSGKLWGSGSERPILALHGWQDNAGTWDPLIPMLYKETNNRPVLAIDLPGHGNSSWIPPGLNYYPWDLPRLVLILKEYYKWKKVSLLTHSMGSIAGFRYSTIFPEDVDFYIAVDILFYEDYNLKQHMDIYQPLLRKSELLQTCLDKEPPSYTREDIIKKWHTGLNNSVALESVPYLLKRGAKPSKQDPNKLYFSRDPRLKYNLFNPEDKGFVEASAMRLKCPTLYVKAIDSPYAIDEFAVNTADMIAKNNDKFEIHHLPGTHHIHLNNPELVLPLITKFLRKNNFVK